MFVSQGDASVLLRIGAIRNYVGAACQCVDGFEAVDSEKRHDTLRDNMFSRNKKTALVTGASSGMGKAIAKRLIEDGYQVYAAARHVERMDDLAQLGARPVRMDISSEAEVATAIDTDPRGGRRRGRAREQRRLRPVRCCRGRQHLVLR